MPVKDKKKKKQRVKQKQTQKQTVSQKVVVNIGDKAISKKRKTTTRQKQTATKPSNEYAFLVNQQNSFQTAMANQLNMLEQSRERFTQMRDVAIGEEREAIRGELLNINRQMTRVFDDLNDQGIDVGAMLGRVAPAPPQAQPAQFTPRRIRPEDVGLVSRASSPPATLPPGAAGFPMMTSESSIYPLSETTESPPSSTSSSSRVTYPVVTPQLGSFLQVSGGTVFEDSPPPSGLVSLPMRREPSDVSAVEQPVPEPIPITRQQQRAEEIERLAGFDPTDIPTIQPRDIVFSEPALDTPPAPALGERVSEQVARPVEIDPTIEGGGAAEPEDVTEEVEASKGAKNIQGISRADKAFKAFIKKVREAELINQTKATRRKNAFRELLAANENKRGRDKKLPKQILREEIDRLNKELKLDFPSVKTEELVELGAEGAKEAKKEKAKKKKPRN